MPVTSPDESSKYVTEVDGTLKSRSIVFGDPDTCNITISDDGKGGGSQMTITLPENFGRTASDGTTTLTTQTYDMRSVIEAIMELNRRTAFLGSNCSFLTAMQKHQTRAERYDEETGKPIDPDNPDQFACNRIEDGLPAARNGEYDVPSDIDGTVITADSIAKLQQNIEKLTNELTAANTTIFELSTNYQTLYEATRIKSFEFTVKFSQEDMLLISPPSTLSGLKTANQIYAIGAKGGNCQPSSEMGFDAELYENIILNGCILNCTMTYTNHPTLMHRTANVNTVNKVERAIRFMLGTYSKPAVIAYPYIHIQYIHNDQRTHFEVSAVDIADSNHSIVGTTAGYGLCYNNSPIHISIHYTTVIT